MSAPAPGSGAQIADLSYRTYDGPLRTHTFRWWTITANTLRLVVRKKGFWPLVVMAALPYLLPAIQFYVASSVPDRLSEMLGSRDFGDRFYGAYSGGLFWVFLLTLLAGAGSIAADNRANALQVYLAKPITKLDYLVGKWSGTFIILAAAGVIPALALFIFCWGLFAKEGFIRENPTLVLRILGASLLPAVLHTSVMTGVSASTKNPRVAGALYAGLYFILGAVAQVVSQIVRESDAELAATISHLSPQGLLTGLGQRIYGSAGGFLMFGPPDMAMPEGPKPDLTLMVVVAAALCVLGIVIARARIRAVEVVQG